MLSRDQMEQVIRSGGSVLHGGRLIGRVEQLPTDADLARGNPAQEALAAQALEAQIAALQAQYDRLTASKAPQTGASSNPDHLAALQGAPELPPGDLETDIAQPGRIAVGAEHPFVETIGQELADQLVAAGYDTPDAIVAATDEQLLAIKGMKPATLKKLRTATVGAGRE